MIYRNIAFLSVSLTVSAGFAQHHETVPPEAGTHLQTFTHAVPAPGPMLFQAGVAGEGVRQFAMEFVGGEFGLAGKVIKGSPYSADAVTETTQALADGNRIRHQSSTRVYRDSQGRTRRESVLGVVGLAPDVELPKLVFISDPVAGFNYVLNLKERTATKSKITAPDAHLSALHSRLSAAPAEERHVEVNAEAGGTRRMEVRTFVHSSGSTASQEAKSESLGRQNKEGVIADGTRTTFTIPAGRIGNERAIEIVSERWYSSELETVISTRQVDPRNGETAFRLTNISRSEPAASMFDVPADFKLNEAPGNVIRMRVPAPPK